MKRTIPQEIIEKALEGVKISYTVETVYACILKDGVLEIEDNRHKFTNPTKEKILKKTENAKTGQKRQRN